MTTMEVKVYSFASVSHKIILNEYRSSVDLSQSIRRQTDVLGTATGTKRVSSGSYDLRQTNPNKEANEFLLISPKRSKLPTR